MDDKVGYFLVQIKGVTPKDYEKKKIDNLEIVDNILDITPFKDTVIIGTFFKS